jgi:hypothetical protein
VRIFVIDRESAASMQENQISLSQILSAIPAAQYRTISTIVRPTSLGQLHQHEVCAAVASTTAGMRLMSFMPLHASGQLLRFAGREWFSSLSDASG